MPPPFTPLGQKVRPHMKSTLDLSDEAGMATVEYALVTVAAAAMAAVLIAVVKSDQVREAIASIVSQALSGS